MQYFLILELLTSKKWNTLKFIKKFVEDCGDVSDGKTILCSS